MRLRVQLWKLLRLMLRLNIGIEIVSLMPEKYRRSHEFNVGPNG